MCLTSIATKRTFLSKTKSELKYLNSTHYIGWKVVAITKKGVIRSAHNNANKPFVKGQSTDEQDYRPEYNHDIDNAIRAQSGVYYLKGFHSLISLDDAINYAESYFDSVRVNNTSIRIIRVYIPINSVVVYGYQDSKNIIVSKKMTIPSQIPYSPITGLQIKKRI
jgi:hypothetical protein